MSPEEHRLLEEGATLSRENNNILRQLRGALRWGRFYSILKWVLVIGSTLGAYYYLQPYLFKLFDAYQTLFNDNASLPDLSGLLDKLR